MEQCNRHTQEFPVKCHCLPYVFTIYSYTRSSQKCKSKNLTVNLNVISIFSWKFSHFFFCFSVAFFCLFLPVSPTHCDYFSFLSRCTQEVMGSKGIAKSGNSAKSSDKHFSNYIKACSCRVEARAKEKSFKSCNSLSLWAFVERSSQSPLIQLKHFLWAAISTALIPRQT